MPHRNKNYGRHFFMLNMKILFKIYRGLNLGMILQHLNNFHNILKVRYGNIVNISSIYGVVAPKFEVYDNTPISCLC